MLTGCARTEGYYKQTNKDNTWLSNPQDTEKTESAEAVRVSTKKFYKLMGRIVQRDFSFMRTKVLYMFYMKFVKWSSSFNNNYSCIIRKCQRVSTFFSPCFALDIR